MNGTSSETQLPVRWSKTEHIAWKMPMPAWSGSTPIVWNDRIFLNVAEGGTTGDLFLWCIDRNKGTLLWKQHLSGGNVQMRKQNMSSPSPVTDGTHVWVLTGTGILRAFDFDGKQAWIRDIQKDYGAFGLNWGYGSSPLLFEDSLYVQVLHGMRTDDPSRDADQQSQRPHDLARGTADARHPRDPPDSTTPALLHVNGVYEIVITGGDVVTGHDTDDGREIWRVTGLNPDNDRAIASCRRR
jgi:outer membrane protein assembly factor BamB